MVKRFILVAVAAALLGAGVTSAAMLFKPSLDRTEKWFSIAGVVVSTGFGMMMTLPFLRRRTAETEAPAAPPPESQSVTGCDVGGEIVQVRGVQGNVRIGPTRARTLPSRPKAPTAFTPDPPLGGQIVRDTRTGGPVRQVDDVDGDATIS